MKIHLNHDVDYILGIDEAGRGPLAGPVSVGVVAIPFSLYKDVTEDFFIYGAKDSKQLSPDARNKIFTLIRQYSSEEKLMFSKSFIHAQTIDNVGITRALSQAVCRALKKLEVEPERTFIYLDGSLSAPSNYKQTTIIRGDEKVPIISLASIVAKVTRDAYMKRASKQFPEYFFELHKGYGTKLHRELIRRYGLSKLHRLSYCKGCL